jgi:hypothetical protein
MDMNDGDRKRLNEFLGECSCDLNGRINNFNAEGVWGCRTCNNKIRAHRQFTTAQDMMDLKDKLVEKGMWSQFWYYSHEVWLPIIDINKFRPDGFVTFINWLFNPPRFCKLVADLLKKEEE